MPPGSTVAWRMRAWTGAASSARMAVSGPAATAATTIATVSWTVPMTTARMRAESAVPALRQGGASRSRTASSVERWLFSAAVEGIASTSPPLSTAAAAAFLAGSERMVAACRVSAFAAMQVIAAAATQTKQCHVPLGAMRARYAIEPNYNASPARRRSALVGSTFRTVGCAGSLAPIEGMISSQSAGQNRLLN